MLSPQDNELLTRVGPGTPMGQLLRRFWMPALVSSEVETDGDPLRLRLLGENLVAFRDTAGRVGIVGDHCPHRGASLFLGRNEEGGLRCVYHGWKFDITGRCVDMPNEPPTSTFKDRVVHTAYPTFERNGVVWIYMGNKESMPQVPNLGWSLVPESHSFIDKRYQACNFIQALEGGIDHTHTGFLHRTSEPMVRSYVVSPDDPEHIGNRKVHHPRFETLEKDYGVAIAARRERNDEEFDWHVTHFLMPFFTVLAGTDPAAGHAWVPMDDEHTVTWSMTWHPERPLTEEERRNLGTGLWIHSGTSMFDPPSTEPEGAWRPTGKRSNDWLMDREKARTQRYMGVPGFWLQDQAVQESMGAIYDRSQERLGTADTGIIQVRRHWMKSIHAVLDGQELLSPSRPDAYHVYGANLTLPRDVHWSEGAHDRLWPALAG